MRKVAAVWCLLILVASIFGFFAGYIASTSRVSDLAVASERPTWSLPQLSAHDSHPRLIWMARRGGPVGPPSQSLVSAGQSAWIDATVNGIRQTLFLDRSDLEQVINMVKTGPCDDVCPDQAPNGKRR